MPTLADELKRWLERANMRVHATTGERPRERFERDEQHVLRPLEAGPYRSLVLTTPPARTHQRKTPPLVTVEKRSLATYGAVARGAS